ncbi:MAG: biotin--[acetyl-CoA-carboxylase] ligase [Coriobacteriia bacterium]|nr:biotin--[acetyl-CoA-carboxylase] ligase [Coriobacteriia bacterium]MBN2847253.1 biotin--[acetyl-CoA-carboxylase] ligase [Coriobacteriia bacterium]
MRPARRAAVAHALTSAGGDGLSGEALARALGISRVAVAKHIDALRELGYAIEAVPRTGYRLVSAPDICIPEEVCPLLTDPLWVGCEGGLETASTNNDAKRLARAGAPAGTLVVAARQTGGRGRLGRTWESPGGGVYASTVLRPALAPAAMGAVGLAVSLGVARALERFGVPVGLKWPNDVVADGRKLAGVLVEMAAEADTVEWMVAGCGLNVAGVGRDDAACVREWAPSTRVAEVAAATLDGIAGAYRAFQVGGFGSIADDYRQRLVLAGREVVVRDASGAVIGRGVAETVDDRGALVVAHHGTMMTVVAGDVTLRDPRRPF